MTKKYTKNIQKLYKNYTKIIQNIYYIEKYGRYCQSIYGLF